MTVANSKLLYAGLKEFGLTRAQVRQLLPQWWSPESEKNEDGMVELCMMISRRLSLDFQSLLNGEVRRKDNAIALAYKHSAAATPQSLQGATSIALSLADAVSAALDDRPYIAPASATKMAKALIADGNALVGLAPLVALCWRLGIPVVPMSNLPVGMRKMDGAVIKGATRPVILISKKRSSRAWLAFILAHEIGHISCGHLEKSGSIIDVSLQEQTTFESEDSNDRQENQADQFALDLLGGQLADEVIGTWQTWLTPVDLAVRARQASLQTRAESGHLILRYAFKTKRWPDSMAAMNYLPDDANADLVMRQALLDNLNLDLIADDLRDLVVRLTGIEDQVILQ